jgi:hypothetical protein
MGLDISHDTWHGAYSAFMTWRAAIAKAAGLPALMLMEGYYEKTQWQMHTNALPNYATPKCAVEEDWLPICWEPFMNDPLYILLSHSDCDGEITYGNAGKIADRLEGLLPKLEGDYGGHVGDIKEKTNQFIKGCRAAHKAKQKLNFH